MQWNELLASVLVIVIGWLLKMGLAAIGVEIEPALFNTIVTAVVAYLLALFGVNTFKRMGVKGLR